MTAASVRLFLMVLMIIIVKKSYGEQPKCCDGINALSGKLCKNGNPIHLDCEYRFIMPAVEVEEFYTLEDNGTLTVDDHVVEPKFYCVTSQINSSSYDRYIMCYIETPEAKFHTTKIKVGAILGYISVLFIVLTIAVYLSVPKLFDLQGVCITHSLSGLGLGYFFLGIIQLNYLPPGFCHVLAYFNYIAFMYAFFWLNVLSFHIWRTITNLNILRRFKNWSLIYHLFGIGGTVFMLTLLLIAEYSQLPILHSIKPDIAVSSCWFKSLRETMIYFYGPISILLCLNVVYFIWTVIILWGHLGNCDERKAKVLKHRLILCLKLFFIMGITWIFEVLSAIISEPEPYESIIWIILDTLNVLQGVLIFLILVVFRSRARKGLANRKFLLTRFPGSWKNVHDEEQDDIEEEEISLSNIALN